MNYKNILKVSLAVMASLALLASCAKKEEFNEITELSLKRCLEPQNLSARVDAATGDHVTFSWDVNKDAQQYLLSIYKDEAMTSLETGVELAPADVPYTIRLTADQKYWFSVTAYRLNADGFKDAESESHVAAYDGEVKTYAVKDNLYLEVTGRTATSLSLAWSKDADDYKEVTELRAAPVKGGSTVKKSLSDAEKAAAAATIDGLAASTEYQVTLFYMSASRGSQDTWTVAEQGAAVKITSSAELQTAVAAGGNYFLAYSSEPYSMSTAKPVATLTLVGEMGADGSLPAVTGAVDVSSILASGSSLHFENLHFADAGTNSHVVTFTDDAKPATLDKVEFVNCEISGYKCGLFYNNKKGVLTVGEVLFDSCDIHNILGSGGDCFDIRQATTITTVKFVNNTIYDGIRSMFRIDANDAIKIGTIDFENNTVKNVATMDDGNNRGFFAPRVGLELILKNNLFLWEDGGKTDDVDKAQLIQDNAATVDPTLTASGNYSYAHGKDFFKKVDAATAGFKTMNVDPCYNSKGNFFQLAAQDLIEAKVGASKWWISYVEKPEDLTQHVIEGAHTWNLQDASLFAGEVKNARVRDELMLVGSEDTPLNADGGINFQVPSVLTRKGVPTEGYASFKVNAPGSVDLFLEDAGKTGASVVVALYDDNGLAVQGGAVASSANPGVQKIVVPKVSGEATVYLYSTGAVSVKKLAWSTDILAGNKVLATPKPVVDPVTLIEGDETAVSISWEAVDNAARYQVVFNKRTQEPQTDLTFTVPGEDIAALKAGLYTFTVQALPADTDIYYVKSELGSASFAIQPKSAGGETVEVDLVWDFSDADWQAAFAAYGDAGADITNWDIALNGLTLHSGSKSKYNTTYFQFGGKSGDMDRYFKFTAPEQGTLKITVSNTGSSEALDRTVEVTVGDDVQSQPGGYPSTAPQEIEFSVAAGDVIITAPVNGLRFYKIEFHYSYTTGGNTPVEYDWDFSNSDWQAGFATYGDAGADITNWDLTIDGLTIHSGSKSKYNTTYFQFGGKSGDMDRYFKFTAPDQGTLKITVSNTGSSEALDRTVAVTVGDDVQSQPGGYPSTAPQEIEFSIAAGEVYITAPVNGLRFYKIHYNN